MVMVSLELEVPQGEITSIHFNGSQIIKITDFFLGDSTNFISGSNGDIVDSIR